MKFEVNVRNEAEEAVLVISFFSNSLENINEIQLAKFVLLFDKTSSMYINVRFKDFSFCNLFCLAYVFV